MTPNLCCFEIQAKSEDYANIIIPKQMTKSLKTTVDKNKLNNIYKIHLKATNVLMCYIWKYNQKFIVYVL